jgi:hypothetical protein
VQGQRPQNSGFDLGVQLLRQPEDHPILANPDCDKDTLLIAFGFFDCGFYKRGPIVVRICPLCRSWFEDHSPWDGPAWMLANLDSTLLPSTDIMFGNPVKYTLPWTREGQAHQLKLRQQGIET